MTYSPNIDDDKRIEVVGRIDLTGMEPGREYTVVESKSVQDRMIYLLRPVNGAGNDIKHLCRDIDFYADKADSETPRIKVLTG